MPFTHSISSSSSQPLQPLSHATYEIQKVTPSKQALNRNEIMYTSSFITQNKEDATFWIPLLSLFLKIPFLQTIILFIWERSLASLQRKTPFQSKGKLFNTYIKMPPWFNSSMQIHATKTLVKRFIHEFEEIANSYQVNQKMLQTLSKINFPKSCYQRPFVSPLEQGLKKCIKALFRKTATSDLHLGNDFNTPQSQRTPICTLYLKALISYLNENNSTALQSLSICSPFDNQEGAKMIFTNLSKKHLLHHLKLDLTQDDIQIFFPFLLQFLQQCSHLQTLTFYNEPDNILFDTDSPYWEPLLTTLNNHPTLSSSSFFYFRNPPKTLLEKQASLTKENLKNTAIMPPGFCIKKKKDLR